MTYLCVLCHLKILQDGPAGRHTVMETIDPESLEALHPKLLEQPLPGGLFHKHPFVEFEGAEPGAEIAFELLLPSTLIEHLLGLEVGHQFLHIVGRTFAREELSRGDVEEGHAADTVLAVGIADGGQMDGREKVVLLVVEHMLIDGHSRGHHLGDATFHQSLGRLRVFQLVADGHTQSCPHQSGQIGVEGVIGKAGHLCAEGGTVVAPGKRDAEDARGIHRIFTIGLIEVTAAEEQQGIRIFGLEVVELLHHRGEHRVFLCHDVCQWVLGLQR